MTRDSSRGGDGSNRLAKIDSVRSKDKSQLGFSGCIENFVISSIIIIRSPSRASVGASYQGRDSGDLGQNYRPIIAPPGQASRKARDRKLLESGALDCDPRKLHLPCAVRPNFTLPSSATIQSGRNYNPPGGARIDRGGLRLYRLTIDPIDVDLPIPLSFFGYLQDYRQVIFGVWLFLFLVSLMLDSRLRLEQSIW